MKALLIFFFALSASAQLRGVVLDQEQRPVPYVNIWAKDANVGATSQENGTFSIAASPEQVLVFSAVGFETLSTRIHDQQTIVLKPIVYGLEEVKIGKLRATRELEIGDMQKIRHTHLSGDKPWIYAKLFDYRASYSDTPFIKSIVFYSESVLSRAKIKLRIFGLKDSLPGADLISEDLIVEVRKGFRKNKVDLTAYHLRMPENGVVVGLEWLIIPENFYEFKYVEPKSRQKIALPNYAPKLVVNYLEERRAFHYAEGKWTKAQKTKTSNNKPWDNTTLAPAINLILSN